MADISSWTVPIATGAIPGSPTDAIARGVDLSWVGKLGDAYQKGRNDAYTNSLRDAFKGGVPTDDSGNPDYAAMANKMYQLGDVDKGNTLANIGIQRQFQAQIPRALNLLQTGNPNGAATGPYPKRVAQAESGGNPNAQNPNSTATGTYQFTQPTWQAVSQAHPELGLTPQGITDPQQQQKAMAAFTKDNAAALTSAGIQPTDANLYTAHFLGADGATHFIQGMMQNPNAPAASLVGPQAVQANRSMFFQPNGQPVTAQQFYTGLTSRIGGGQPASGVGAVGGQPQSMNASAISGTNPELTGLIPNGMDPNQFRTGLRTFGALLSGNQATAGLGKALTDQADKIDKALIPTPEQKNYYADRLPNETMSDYEARKAGQTETAKTFAGIAGKQYEEAGKSYQAAQSTMYRLGVIDHSIDALGPNWMGAGANMKAGAAKAWNGLAQSVLPEDVAKKLSIDPNKVATWEDFNKQTTNLGFELARTLGSREAMMIVQQATSAVPSAQQTYLGAKLVSASVAQAAQRQADYYEFLGQHPGQTGADIAFNRTHPVSMYVNAAVQSVAQQQKGQQQPTGAQPMGQPGAAQAAPAIKPNDIVTQNGVRFVIMPDGSGRPIGPAQ